jgi:hypothetical protein
LLYDIADEEKAMEETLNAVTVYPNPNNGELMNISLSGLEKGQLQIRVLDAAGRSLSSHVYAVEGSLQTTLTFEQKLSSGVYLVEITNEGNVRTERLVVQ